jgi:uncharacterized delta-60 repeat protein
MRRHLHNSVHSSSILNPIEPLEPRRLLNAGDLDTTFGTGGGTAQTFGQTSITFYAVALQSDGKIVAVGATNVTEGIDASSQVVIARFKTDGSLDTSFSTDGFEVTALNGSCLGATSVVIQSDQKILVGGEGFDSTDPKDQFNFGFVARLKTDGTLDNTFGTGDVAETQGLEGDAVTLSSTGQIYTVGGPTPTVARFTSAGKADKTFGTNGTFVFNVTNTNINLNDIAIQADGKPVVIGDSSAVGANTQTFVARLTTAGKLDTTFSTDGLLSFSADPSDTVSGSEGVTLAVLSGGKLLVLSGDQSENLLTRINTNGTIDSTFGSGGTIAVQPFSQTAGTSIIESLVVQGDGKLVLGGYSSILGIGLVRLNSDGTADTTFSVDGRTGNSIGQEARAIAINSTTHQLIVAGDTTQGALVAAFHETGGENSPVVRSDQGELGVTGTNNSDTITIALSGTHLITTLNGVQTSFTAKTVKSMTVHGLDGGDSIQVSANITGTVFGDAGNDSIIGSDAAQTLDGGTGDDHIFGGDGPSVILGDDGNDHLFGGASRDSIRGGAGKDTIHGGDGADTLHGDGGSDHVYGDAGKDRLFGDAGNDHLYSVDSSIDIVSGGSGNDSAQIDHKDQYSSIQILIP